MTEETGWLAGIIEGEGYIKGIRRRKNVDSNISSDVGIHVQMTDKDIIERVYRLSGVGSITGPYWPSKATKEVWRWQVCNRRDVSIVLFRIIHLLGERKKIQADRVIGLIELSYDLQKVRKDS